jgi:thymidylate kinase
VTSTTRVHNGRLLSVDGIDGTGKTTLVSALRAKHNNLTLISKLTRLSEVLPMGLYYNALTDIIFQRARNFGREIPDDHWFRILSSWHILQTQELISPSVEQGLDVLLDNSPLKYMVRYIVNNPTQEGIIRQCFEPCLASISDLIVLDAPAAVALSRKGGAFSPVEGGRRGETENDYLAYQEAVRLLIASEARDRGWFVLDVESRTPEDVAQIASGRLWSEAQEGSKINET